MIPLITRETRMSVSSFSMSTCLIWILGRTTKSNSVGSGHVSHCLTSSFDDHLDCCLIVFKDVQLKTRLEKNVCLCVRGPHFTIDHLLVFRSWFYCAGLLSHTMVLFVERRASSPRFSPLAKPHFHPLAVAPDPFA